MNRYSLFVFLGAGLYITQSYSSTPIVSTDKNTYKTETTINIFGEHFGSPPHVVIFDSFEYGTNGQKLSISSSSPEMGSWYSDNGRQPIFNSSTANSGKNSIILVDSDSPEPLRHLIAANPNSSKDLTGFISDLNPEDQLAGFQEVFISYSLKDLGMFPGSQVAKELSTISSTKNVWMMLGNRGDQSAGSSPGMGHDVYIHAWTGGQFLVAGNNTTGFTTEDKTVSLGFTPANLRANWEPNTWQTFKFYTKLNASNPYGLVDAGYYEYQTPSTRVKTSIPEGMMKDQEAFGIKPIWDRVKFGGWQRTSEPGVARAFDDLYMAIGANAQARVEFGESENYRDSIDLKIIPHNSWSDDSIELNISTLRPDDYKNKYIYITNSNGETNQKGYQVPLARPLEIPKEAFKIESNTITK